MNGASRYISSFWKQNPDSLKTTVWLEKLESLVEVVNTLQNAYDLVKC